MTSHPWVPAGSPQYTGGHGGRAVDGSSTAHTMTKKSLRHTRDSQHGSGATYAHDSTCDAAGDELRTDQESPRLLPVHSGNRFLSLLKKTPRPQRRTPTEPTRTNKDKHRRYSNRSDRQQVFVFLVPQIVEQLVEVRVLVSRSKIGGRPCKSSVSRCRGARTRTSFSGRGRGSVGVGPAGAKKRKRVCQCLILVKRRWRL